jgi:hypothetical protein
MLHKKNWTKNRCAKMADMKLQTMLKHLKLEDSCKVLKISETYNKMGKELNIIPIMKNIVFENS